MAQPKSVKDQIASEAKRRQTTGARLGRQLRTTVIQPLSRHNDKLFLDSFMSIIALMIIDRLEIVLTDISQRLEKGKLVDLDGPVEIISYEEFEAVIEHHRCFVGHRDTIAAWIVDFDGFMQQRLDELADAGVIPRAEYKFETDDTGRTWIQVSNLADFVPVTD